MPKIINFIFALIFFLIFSQVFAINENNLYFFDKNSNSKVDTLIIEFSSPIKGNIDFSKLQLYSNTGGLSSVKINSETGFFNSFSIIDKYLILDLIEQDLPNINLNIDNTTSSDLRLKTNLGIGITDLSGVEIDKLSLSTSFSSYNSNNIFNKTGENYNDFIISITPTETNTGELSETGSIENSGSLIIPFFTNTGVITNITNSGAYLSGVTSTEIVNYIGINWGTGVLDNSGILIDGKFLFTNLTSDSNYNYSVNLFDFSGSIVDSFMGSFLTLSGQVSSPSVPIFAKNLYYGDNDNNGKVDIFKIEFSSEIKGNLIYDKLKIYSNTGGLSTRLINSETGLINNFSISGSYLILNLIEQDNLKNTLNITNNTSSDLRLKSLSGIGITDLYGLEISVFSLTSSFDNYHNVFKIDSSSSGITTLINEEIITPEVVSSGGGGNNEQIIPDIIYTLQQPSYVIQNNEVLICDYSKEECKINFNLENSFINYSENNYLCSLDYGNGEIINSCNPSTYTFARGIFDIKMKIIDKNNSSNFKEKIIKLYNNPGTLEIPFPIITIQSGLENYRCNSEDCSVNFTADDSFKILSSSKYVCLWDFGGGLFIDGTQNKCNPGYVHYSPGSYDIKLKIYEAGNSNNSKESIVRISNIYKSSLSEEEKKEIPKENIAPVAKITLQGTIGGTTKKQIGNIMYCIGVEKCSVNFTAQSSYDLNHDKLSYFWDFGNGSGSTRENPTSTNYSSGSYIVKLKITDPKGLSGEDIFYVVFVSEEDFLGIKKDELEEDLDFDKIFKNLLTETELELSTETKLFDETLKILLTETTDELYFEKKFEEILSSLEQNESLLKFTKIKLQGKIGKNLYIIGDKIFCKSRNNCKINLAINGDKIKDYKYSWIISNGDTYTGINPKTISFSHGKYFATLTIFDEFNNIVNVQKVVIFVSKIPTKTKAKTDKTKILKVSNFSVNLSPQKTFINENENIGENIKIPDSKEKTSIFVLISTIIFSSFGIILKFLPILLE